MLLATYPFTTFRDFQRQVDELFDDSLREFTTRPYPPLNIWETADLLHIEAELPGLTMADVELLIEGAELTIRGQRKAAEFPDATMHRSERPSGAFLRKLTLPRDVDAEKIEATLRDGVLSIRLPKSDRARVRKIEVKAQ